MKKCFYCILGLFAFLVHISVYAETLPSTKEVKYIVRTVDADITQRTRKFTEMYGTKEDMQLAVKEFLEKGLAEKNLLANTADEKVMILDFFVDYRRNFVGDGTPFPVSSLRPPEVKITTEVSTVNKTVRQQLSAELTTKDFAFTGGINDALKKEAGSVIGVGKWILNDVLNKRSADVEKFNELIVGINAEQLTAKYTEENLLSIQQEEQYKYPGLANTAYIPDSIANDYLTELASDNRKIRIKTYKKITRAWLPSEPLFDHIEGVLLEAYKKDEPKKVKELRWVAKTLASSGLEKYRPTLTMVGEEAFSDVLKQSMKSYLLFFDKRQASNEIVHNIKTMTPEETWKVNQLANMINSDSAQLRSQAIKDIYRNYKTNEYLLNFISQRLSNEASTIRYRYLNNANNYAWFCRILGESKNAKYKPLLERMAKEAHVKKVRKYAKKFARKL
jgi:hypothetical protein